MADTWDERTCDLTFGAACAADEIATLEARAAQAGLRLAASVRTLLGLEP